jgi:hypothetical protein
MNPQIDMGIASGLTKGLESKGFTNVHTTCTGVSTTTAKCHVTGNNPQGQPIDHTLTVVVNQQNGNIMITSVM